MLPWIEVAPRSLIESPPPGAPEFWLTRAPANLPYNAPSNVGGGVVPVICSADTDATAFAAFDRLIEEASPEITTSSSDSEDSSRVTFNVCELEINFS